MSSVFFTRPAAREAGPELFLLQKWEETAGWLVQHTAKWPKSARFSLVQKVDNHALDVLEMLVVARYEPGKRATLLRSVNLRLERLRFLMRISKERSIMPAHGFETAMRGIDELGRMVHAWRVSIGERSRPGSQTSPGQAARRGYGLATRTACVAGCGTARGSFARAGSARSASPPRCDPCIRTWLPATPSRCAGAG